MPYCRNALQDDFSLVRKKPWLTKEGYRFHEASEAENLLISAPLHPAKLEAIRAVC